jgi:hypothetical protein
MAFIVTPAQFSRRSAFCRQLASLTAADLGLTRAAFTTGGASKTKFHQTIPGLLSSQKLSGLAGPS